MEEIALQVTKVADALAEAAKTPYGISSSKAAQLALELRGAVAGLKKGEAKP